MAPRQTCNNELFVQCLEKIYIYCSSKHCSVMQLIKFYCTLKFVNIKFVKIHCSQFSKCIKFMAVKEREIDTIVTICNLCQQYIIITGVTFHLMPFDL